VAGLSGRPVVAAAAAALTEGDARALVDTWQRIKAQALGGKHNVGALEQVREPNPTHYLGIYLPPRRAASGAAYPHPTPAKRSLTLAISPRYLTSKQRVFKGRSVRACVRRLVSSLLCWRLAAAGLEPGCFSAAA
jgi:hypothetical protein